MDTRRELLKPSLFGNEKRRLLENKMMKEKRSIRRTRIFNLQRDIDFQENENIIPNKADRKIMLQKFLAEKEALKKATQKKKPPFVVGKPHHGSSPLMRNDTADKMENKRKSPSQLSFQPPVIRSTKELTLPITPTVFKRSAQNKPFQNVSNLVNKLEKGCDNSHSHDADEELAAPLGEVEGREMLEEEVAVGGTNDAEVQPLGTDETPSSVEAEVIPKSTLEKSRVELESTRSSLLSAMTSVEVEEIVEDVQETEPLTATGTENYFMPVSTRRRSLRLMAKMQATPASCTAGNEFRPASCEKSTTGTEDHMPVSTLRRSPRLMAKMQATPASCTACNEFRPASSEKSKRKTKRSPRMTSQAQKNAVSPFPDTEQECKTKSIPRRSPRMSTRSQKKAVSPRSEAEPELGQPEMIDITKPSTSPSILTVCENKNVSEIPKKAKTRKQPSVCSASPTSNVEQNDG